MKAKDYYESWQFVPILIIATTYSCIVNFLASVYMAKKKSLMSLVTAMSGAVTNFVLNLVFIPRMGANGAALATVCAFLVVFVTRGIDTRRYIKIDFKLPVLLSETAVLVSQSVLLLKFGNTLWIYGFYRQLWPNDFFTPRTQIQIGILLQFISPPLPIRISTDSTEETLFNSPTSFPIK